MRVEDMRRRLGPSTPGVGRVEEGSTGEGRIGEELAGGGETTAEWPRAQTLPPDLRAMLEDSFRRNEAGYRYLTNR